MGFRDVEHTLEKPKDVFRILALGDSFTYGSGVSFEDAYLNRLEKMLNNRDGKHPRVEIINAGIYRYFPEPERILLEHYGLNFSPDVIIVAFLPNDVADTHLGMRAIKVNKWNHLVTRGAEGTSGLMTFFYVHSHVFRILFDSFTSRRAGARLQLPEDEIYKPNGYFERDWDTVESDYEKIVRLGDSIKAHVVILHIPQQGPWDEARAYPSMRLGKWSTKHGASFVDALTTLKEVSKDKKLYFEIDGHCNPNGHEAIAKSLFEGLLRDKIIP